MGEARYGGIEGSLWGCLDEKLDLRSILRWMMVLFGNRRVLLLLFVVLLLVWKYETRHDRDL